VKHPEAQAAVYSPKLYPIRAEKFVISTPYNRFHSSSSSMLAVKTAGEDFSIVSRFLSGSATAILTRSNPQAELA